MKNIFLNVFVVLLFLQSNTFASAKNSCTAADKEQTVVKVKLQNAAGCSISIINNLIGQGGVRVDSIYHEENGYRVYTLKPAYSVVAFLIIKYPAAKIVQQNGIPQVSFLLKKGATITLEGDANTPALAKVSSKDQDVMDFQVFREKEAAIEMDYWQRIKVKLAHPELNDSGKGNLKELLMEMSGKKETGEKEFVKLYPRSYAGLQVFYRYYQKIDKNVALGIFNEFPKSFHQDGAGVEIAHYFDAIRNAAAGNKVLAFRQEGIDGKMVDTDSLKGKVVIIDFWGSWCGPCRKSHPHLKALYQKYHDKGLEIIGVAQEGGTVDGKQLIWRKSVAEDGLPWLQLLNDPQGIDLVAKYAVTAFPTKLIVDRNGMIVLRVNNSIPEELDQKLEELFK